MNIASTVARLLLGLLFTAAGASLFLGTPPPEPGLAGKFDTVMFASHYMLFISAAQGVLGVLLLSNRFVPLALIMLAAFTYNSVGFHATMAQSSLSAPVVVFALWLLVCLKYRALFAPIFAAKPNLGAGKSQAAGIQKLAPSRAA